MIAPGAMLGILGGGQLGKMFAIAAQTLGYRVAVLDPDADCPAHAVCHNHIIADYGDFAALDALRSSCAAVTTEFENVPAASLRYLAQSTVVRPHAEAVAIAQNRASEKQFLQKNGFATARFFVVEDRDALQSAVAEVGFPAIVKTSTFGYDGKGQYRVRSSEEAQQAFSDAQQQSCVVEELVALKAEISVVLACDANGQNAVFPVAENIHANGILDMTIAPARISDDLAHQAVDTSLEIARALNYVGVMAVEFFVLEGDKLLVNEIAPRPHNSGHFTLDACLTSQFEQQVRALCDMPLGAPWLRQPAVMVNLLGDLWKQQPDWVELLREPAAKLHLYGKTESRPGRKMGHFTCMGNTHELAYEAAKRIRSRFGSSYATAPLGSKGTILS